MAGVNTAIVYLFRRATSAPAVPSATLTYTFATNVLSGSLSGWSTTVPAGTDPVYVTVATASSADATDTIASGEWASPVVLAQNGAAGATGSAGAPGSNAATVYLFQRTTTATPPSLPSASVTYTFATGVASGVNNGWAQSMPTSGGAYRWITTGTALGTGSTDTIASGEWAAASLLAQDGQNGVSIYTATIYRTVDFVGPVFPPTGGTFNFATGVLTPPESWQLELPTDADSTGVQSSFTFIGSGPETVTAGTWGAVMPAPRVQAPNRVITPGRFFADAAINGTGGVAIAGLRLKSGGAVARGDGATSSTYTDYSAWFSGTVSGTYYVRFLTRSSTGGTVGGSDSGWQAMTSDRTVTLTVAALETASAQIDYYIAADSDGTTVLAAGLIELTAQSLS